VKNKQILLTAIEDSYGQVSAVATRSAQLLLGFWQPVFAARNVDLTVLEFSWQIAILLISAMLFGSSPWMFFAASSADTKHQHRGKIVLLTFFRLVPHYA
jgi:hypothetical protein